MISLEKWMILAPLQKLPKNVKDLSKLIVPKGIKKLLKVQKIANYGHTGGEQKVKQESNVAMHVLHAFLGFVLTTAANHLGRYSLRSFYDIAIYW